MEFRSGDIQKIIGKHKQRVEYLSRQLRIVPEIEEVEGTGRAHLWSFKNALQFAVAQTISEAGLTTAEIKKVLWFLESDAVDTPNALRNYLMKHEEIHSVEFYNPSKDENLYLVILKNGRGEKAVDVVRPGEDWSMAVVTKAPQPFRAVGELACEAFIVFNLGAIKRRVLAYAGM